MTKLRIFRPIKTNLLYQDFGENKACAKLGSDGLPLKPYKVVGKSDISCPIQYGELYPLLGMKGHNGKDWSCYYGEPAYFSADYEGWAKPSVDPDGGIGIDIVSQKPILRCNEKGGCKEIHYIKQRLWHAMKVIEYKPEIMIGDIVGWGDSTGISGGNHFHEGYKWCNEKGEGIHNNNGYYGAFDVWHHPDVEFINAWIIEYANLKTQVGILEKVLGLYRQLAETIKGRKPQ